MKTSVIIVTYNGMKWIKNCLESILKSTIPISIIVVDNCSNDGTVEFIKVNFPRVNLIEQRENLGFGKANNIGISLALKASSEYVFLLNQDAFIEENTIEKLIEVSQQNLKYGILSPIHADGDGTKLDESFCYYIGKSCGQSFISDLILNKTKKDIYSLPMINAAAWLIPKITLENVGGFDTSFFLYGEDDNYCQRVLYNNFQIGIVPTAFIRHDSDNNNTKEIIKGSEKYYAKFLNHIKVSYGNVNTDNYKNVSKLKYSFLKKSIISLIKFDLADFKINWTKAKLLAGENLKEKVLFNRQKGKNYLE
ncbi:glycosyltransferase family 2 protein [Flavobacterium sp. KJJ]|uniref:glycosyltransferase family 2 protein n=1 Tax=Flavobacterium sp. KJJ TaxID=1270193 RepID=UPI000493A78B|nr:glycosyltransferase family 2 protein [Flavobacterium sp. KJJ]